jgi:oligopeptide transport system substrate-binding protein
VILGAMIGLAVLTAYFSFIDELPALPEEPENRGTFRFAVVNDPGSLDPGTTSALVDFRLIKCLYQTLMVNQWGGEGLEPGAALDFPDVSEDGLVYTFTLREEAKWSDGTPVTAADFVYGWRRALLPDNASDYAALFFVIEGAQDFFDFRAGLLEDELPAEVLDVLKAEYPNDDPDKLTGERKWEITADRFEQTVGIKALDDLTLQVTLAQPTAYFIELCAFPTFSPLPRHVLEDESLTWVRGGGMMRTRDFYFRNPDKLVTNGPYVLTEWREKVRIVMDQNPHYWAKDQMGNRRIIEETIQDVSLQLLRYQEGELDWIPDAGRIKQKLVELDYEFAHSQPNAGTYYYQFNCRPELPNGAPNPMSDVRVRRAMSMCINRQEIVESVTRMNEPIARSLVPEGQIPGYISPVESSTEYDPEAAKALLAEAGYPGGVGMPPIELLINSDGTHTNIALAIKRVWEEQLGLTVSLVATEFKVYLDRRKQGNFMVSRAGWFGDYIDPTTWLDMYRESDSNNDAKYINPAYDALLEQAARELDPEARFELLNQAEAMLLADAPICPIYYYTTIMVFDPEKVDLRPNAWNNLRLELIPITEDSGND